ncbi:hypothetical protein BX616_009025 [Lobosporangium transversale]|nr:hypothetical protein BX616_009025 [Lobosporangium transversale]
MQVAPSKDSSLTIATTTADIVRAHTALSSVREALQSFETSISMLKQSRNQQLRAKRAGPKLCAAERGYVQGHDLKACRAQTSAGLGYLPSASTVQAGTSASFSGALPVAVVTIAAPVARPVISPADGWCTRCNRHHITNLKYEIHTRELVSKVSTESSVCASDRGSRYKCRESYAVESRETHAGAAIAIAGASVLLSNERQTPPFFSRQVNPSQINTTAATTATITTTYTNK